MSPNTTTALRLASLQVLLLLVILTVPARAGISTDEIVARVLKAYGGTDAIGKVRSVAAHGTIIDYFSDREGVYCRYYERPGKLRVEIMHDDGGEVRILNNGSAWQSGRDGIVRARPMTHRSMIYQYTYLDLPMGFADHATPVTYGGKDRLDGHDVYLLKVAPADSPEIRVYVDTDTFTILRVAATFSMGIMGGSELATEYGDFRPENGVLFPHLLANYAGEIKLSEIILPRIQINAVIPETLFSPSMTPRP